MPGSVNGNSTADILVRFRAISPAVLFAWGGHLAQSRYWDTAGGGARDGASLVSGAPWHMRTLQLDGAGNKNQDRSIQPSAIVGELPPQALSPVPPAPPPTSRPPTAPRDPSAPAGPGRLHGRRSRRRARSSSARSAARRSSRSSTSLGWPLSCWRCQSATAGDVEPVPRTECSGGDPAPRHRLPSAS